MEPIEGNALLTMPASPFFHPVSLNCIIFLLNFTLAANYFPLFLSNMLILCYTQCVLIATIQNSFHNIFPNETFSTKLLESTEILLLLIFNFSNRNCCKTIFQQQTYSNEWRNLKLVCFNLVRKENKEKVVGGNSFQNSKKGSIFKERNNFVHALKDFVKNGEFSGYMQNILMKSYFCLCCVTAAKNSQKNESLAIDLLSMGLFLHAEHCTKKRKSFKGENSLSWNAFPIKRKMRKSKCSQEKCTAEKMHTKTDEIFSKRKPFNAKKEHHRKTGIKRQEEANTWKCSHNRLCCW